MNKHIHLTSYSGKFGVLPPAGVSQKHDINLVDLFLTFIWISPSFGGFGDM